MKSKKLFIVLMVMMLVMSMLLVACAPEEEDITSGEWTVKVLPTLEKAGEIHRVNEKGEEETFVLPILSSDKYSEKIVTERSFDNDGVSKYTIDVNGSEFVFEITLPKYTVTIVPRVEPTDTVPGNIEHYKGTNGKLYRDENHTEEIKYVDTILAPKGFTYVERVEASYGKSGMLAHYEDKDGNKFILNGNGEFAKIEDESIIVIPEIKGTVTLIINDDVENKKQITHTFDDKITQERLDKIVADYEADEYIEVYYSTKDADGKPNYIEDITKLCEDNKEVEIYAYKYYTVTLKRTDGTVIDTISVLFNDQYREYLPAGGSIVPTGYSFVGWAYDIEGKELLDATALMKKGNHELYLITKIINYTITVYDGGAVTEYTYAYGADILLPTDLTKADHKFGDYYLDEGYVKKNTYTKMPAENIDLYIKWIPTYDTNIKFQLNNDTYSVISYVDTNATSVVIPDTFMDKKVTCIGSNAFLGMEKLTSVTIGNNIEVIGASAFADCIALKSIVGPNVHTINEQSIDGIADMELISLPKLKTIVGTGISGIEHVGSIQLDSIESLPTAAISNNAKIDKLSLPKASHFAENAIMGNNEIGILELGASSLDYSMPFINKSDIGIIRISAESVSQPIAIANDTYAKNVYANADIFNAIQGFKQLNNLYLTGTKLCTGALTDNAGNADIRNIILEESIVEAESNAVNLSKSEIYFKSEHVPVLFDKEWNKSKFGYRLYSQDEPSDAIIANSDEFYWKYDEKGNITGWLIHYTRGVLFEQVGDAYVVADYVGSNNAVNFAGPYMGKPIIGIKENAFNGKNITRVTIKNNVTIGANAFKNCTKLTTIEGADKITSIGAGAFSGCTSLASADIFTGIDTIEEGIFDGCTKIKSVNMPNIKTLKAGAFKGCDLNTVTLTNVETIEDNVFSGNVNIATLDLPNVKTLADASFNGAVIGNMTMNTASVIASSTAFDGASVGSIEVLGHNVKVLKNVDKIIVTGDTIKRGDIVAVPGNNTIILSNSIVNAEMCSITSSANQDILMYLTELPVGFVDGYNDSSNYILLQSATEPTWDMWAKNVNYFIEDVDGIRKYVLDYSRGLEFREVGGDYYISGYTGTDTELVIPDKYLDKNVTSVAPLEGKSMGTELTKVTLGANINTIGNNAFSDNYNLSEIVGMDSVITIGDNALFGTAITTLTINNVERIGFNGLAMCSLLTTVVSPKLKFIDDRAFASDGALTSVTLTSAKSAGVEAFMKTGIKEIDISSLTSAGNNIFSGLALDSLTAGNTNVDGWFDTDVLGNVTIKKAMLSNEMAGLIINSTTIDELYVSGNRLVAGNINVQNNINRVILESTITSAPKDAIMGSSVPVYLKATEMSAGLDSGFAGANKVSLYSKTAPTADQWAAYGNYYYIENGVFKQWTLEYTKGLLFTLSGSDYVVGGYTGKDTEVIIPTIYDGKKVVGIKDNAFSGNNAITSVELSAELVSVGQSAFEGCTLLTTIKGLEKVTSIGANAFKNIDNIDNVVVNATTIGANAFSGDTFGTLTLSASVIDNIDVNAIAGVSVTTLNIDGNIASRALVATSVGVENIIGTNLAVGAVGPIQGLTRVYIGESVETAVLGAVKSELAGVDLLINNVMIPAGFVDGWNASAINPALYSATAPTADMWINHDKFYKEDSQGNIEIWPLPNYTIGLTFEPVGEEYAVKNYAGTATEVIVPDTYLGKRVTAIGMRAFKDNASITKVTLGANVKKLGIEAFKNCSLLSTVDGMERLEDLGNGSLMATAITAFNVPLAIQAGNDVCRGCKQLNSVNIPKLDVISNGMFAYCSALQSIDLAKKEIIGIGGFQGCSQLTSLDNADSVLTIESSGFESSGIVNVVFANVTKIDRMAFNDCTSLESFSAPKLTELGDTSTPTQYVFAECTSLTTLDLPMLRIIHGGYNFQRAGITSIDLNNVTEISADAFLDATALTTISNINLAIIPSNAFNNCSSLKNISLPNVTSIGEYAFYGCAQLTTVSMPNIENIDNNAFSDCKKLSNIGTTDKLTTLNSSTFYKTGFVSIDMPALTTINGSFTFAFTTSLTTVNMPNLSTVVEQNNNWLTFKGCSALESIHLPKLTILGQETFAECSSLTTVDMPLLETIYSDAFYVSAEPKPVVTLSHPESIITLEKYAFEDSGIVNASFPNVTTVSGYAFSGCANLKTVDLPKAESVNTYAFMNCTGIQTANLPMVTTAQGNVFANAVIGELTIGTSDVTHINRDMLSSTTITTINIHSAMLPRIYDCSGNSTNIKTVHITGGDLVANSIRSDKGVTNVILDETVVNAAVDAVNGYFKGTIFLEHASVPTTFVQNWNRYNKPVLIYSADNKGTGYWHYDTDNKTPVKW